MSRNMKNIAGAFVIIICVGLFSTAVTKNVLDKERERLYATTPDESSSFDRTQTSVSGESSTEHGGPAADIMTKDKYMEKIRIVEEQITDVWANVTDNGSTISAINAAKYEKGLWDEELNNILQMFYSGTSAGRNDEIRQEETTFSAERERRAQNAAKAAGEALDGLSYTKEYIRLTKEKVYEYIDRYFVEN